MTDQREITCRLCGAVADYLGTLHPYLDYSTPVYACKGCGARLAIHDPSVHERLHSNARSSYAWHKDLAAAAAAYFARGDREGLKRLLDTAPKNRLVMAELDKLPVGSRVMEVGCSRGYLTAYAVRCGHRVLGVDVSVAALVDAKRLFGERFALVNDPMIAQGAPYDFIYHVGTIGCVDDPVGLIRSQLDLLRSGGLLVCNAPDVAAAVERGRLWSVGTTPPDLVTLFNRHWFSRAFSALAQIELSIAPEDPGVSLRRVLGRDGVAAENAPRFRLFEDAPETTTYSSASPPISPLRGAARSLVRVLHTLRVIPHYAHEYGILVRMTKR